MAKNRIRSIGQEILEGIREIKRGEVGRVSVLRQEKEPGRPIVIPQEENRKAATEAEREILIRLAEGEQEIARGEGHDLEDVLAEADSLLLRP